MKILTTRRYKSLWMLFAEGIILGVVLSLVISLTVGLIAGGIVVAAATYGIITRNILQYQVRQIQYFDHPENH